VTWNVTVRVEPRFMRHSGEYIYRVPGSTPLGALSLALQRLSADFDGGTLTAVSVEVAEDRAVLL
jgi:hypothetical protein